jgi:hypothetical protein
VPEERAVPHQSVGTVSYAPPGANQQPRAAPYFVVIHQPKAVVYDSRTGKVTAVIRAPRAAPGGFTAVAPAGDDQTFVLATGTGFYELFVGPHGSQPDPLIRLPVPAEPAGTPFAVSGSGSELALALPQRASAAEASEIMVVSLSTGAVHTLRSPDPGTIQGLSWADPGSAAQDPGWAGNDRLLFGWTDASPNRRIARQRSGLRLLDPATSGTDLLASRLVVPASVRVGGLRGLDDPLINVDGTVVFATMTSHADAARVEAAVVEFSAATGRPLGTVTPLTNEAGTRTWCGALWVNPSGSHALATCGPSWGEISGVQFTRENPRLNFSTDPSLVAW